MVQVTIRTRHDEFENDTSWALVTMRKPSEAQTVLTEADQLPAPLSVATYNKSRAASSTGQMGKVKTLAASKKADQEATHSGENAHMQVRSHLVGRSNLKFSPVYGKFNTHVMSWWFMCDLAKKLLVNVVFAIGQDAENSLWKFHVFLIIGAYIIMHAVFNPSPGRTSNLFEMSASVMILIILYTSSIGDFKQENTLQGILGVLLGLMIFMLGCVKAWSDKIRLVGAMHQCLVCVSIATATRVTQRGQKDVQEASGERHSRHSGELNEMTQPAEAAEQHTVPLREEVTTMRATDSLDEEASEEHTATRHTYAPDEFESILPQSEMR
jgi:hypothetical protein